MEKQFLTTSRILLEMGDLCYGHLTSYPSSLVNMYDEAVLIILCPATTLCKLTRLDLASVDLMQY